MKKVYVVLEKSGDEEHPYHPPYLDVDRIFSTLAAAEEYVEMKGEQHFVEDYELFDKSSTVQLFDGDRVLEDACKECDGCEEYYPYDMLYDERGGKILCESCYDDWFK